MAVHILPTFANHLGTFTVTVTILADVTTPTIQTIVGLRSGENSIELIPGTLQPTFFTVSVCDDAAGFWLSAINASATVLITLDEGSGATLVFNGDISQRDTIINEVYNDGSTKIRQIDVVLYSILERLRVTSIDDMVTLILANDVALTGGPEGHGHTLTSLFACAIDAATDQTYNATDGYYLSAGGEDWEFTDAADNDFDFDEVYVRTSENDNSADEYWDSTDPLYLGNSFDNCYDLVVAMARNFNFIPVYDYDIANARHRIKLLQASRNYAAAVTLDAPESSSFSPGQHAVLLTAFVDCLSGNGSSWYFENPGYPWVGFYPGMTQVDLPSGVTPQIEVELLFTIYEVGNTSTETLFTSAGAAITSVTVKGANIFSGAGIFQKALLSYIVRRYYGNDQVTYHRSYPMMRASGGSHTAIDLMMGVNVDGTAYDITAVDKDFNSGKLSLTLVKM